MINKLVLYFKDHAYVQFANGIFLLSGMAIHIYLSRGGLPFEEYGQFNVLINLLATLSILFTTGIPLYSVRKIARNELSSNDFLALFTIDSILSALVVLVLLLFPDQIGAVLFADESLSYYIPIIAVTLPAYILFGFIVSYYNGKKGYGIQSAIQVLNHIVKVLGVILLAYLVGKSGAILAYAIPPILIASALFIYYRVPSIVNIPDLIIRVKVLWRSKELWLFATPTTLYAFVNAAIISVDILLVENLLSDTELSNFSVTTTISRVPIYILVALGTVFFPVYSAHTKPADIRKDFKKDLALEILGSIIIIIAYMILGKFALEILFGEEFGSLNEILLISTLSNIAYALRSLMATKLQALNNQWPSLLSAIVSLVALYLIGPVLINEYGLNGAALNLLVISLPVWIVLVVYFFYVLHKRERVHQKVYMEV